MGTALATRDSPAEAGGASPGPAAPITGGLPAPATSAPSPVPETVGEIALPDDRRLRPWRLAAAPRRRLSPGWLSFAVIVVLPVALAALYYFAFAADQYVSEFRFALRSAEPAPAEFGGLLPASAASAPVVSDSYIVVQYIRSRAIIDDLGSRLDLRKFFSTRRADWPARLHLPVSVEELVDYWKDQVDAYFDVTNGTVVVRVRAFTPRDALRLAQGVLGLSQRLVNHLSARARQNAVHDAEAAVTNAERRLAAALARLRNFRDAEGLIDPGKSADSSQALADRVRDALVRARTELTTLRQYIQPDAPSARMLKARIAALEEQRRSIESGVTDTTKTRAQALSRVMGRYEELESRRRFAENSYQHALAALDRSRQNAERQQVYVADFVPPRLPEEALYPRRGRAVAIVFVVAFAVWAIGGLSVRSIRDHL
jgi:capsular polysaccharide transport system permease protein